MLKRAKIKITTLPAKFDCAKYVKTFPPEAAWMRRESRKKVRLITKRIQSLLNQALVNHIRSKSFQL
jgi:hypothetical protein